MSVKNLLLLVSLLCVTHLRTQDISIGEWQSHLPYQFGIDVDQSPTHIFYATPWSVVSIDKSDLTYKRLSTITGLSDTGVSKIKYDAFNDQLIIAYTNSNIDIVSISAVESLPNILLNNTITGSKSINDIWVSDAQQMFLAMDFGMVEIDPREKLFKSTIITKTKVNTVAVLDDYIFAGTESGLFQIRLTETTNIADFGQWEQTIGFENIEVKGLEVLEGQLYIHIQEGVFRATIDGDVAQIYMTDNTEQIIYLSTSKEYLVIGTQKAVDQPTEIYFYKNDELVGTSGNGCSNIGTNAAVDEQNRVWYSDGGGSYKYSQTLGGDCQLYNIESPWSHVSSEIDIKNSLVAVASGGVSDNYVYLFGREGFYLRNGSSWFNFNESINSEIASRDLLSVYRIKFHPTSNELYAGSYWAGLLKYNWVEQSYTLYNKTNSTLRGAIGDEQRERVTGIAFDKEENLWTCTFGATNTLHVKTSDDQWASFSLRNANTANQLIIDKLGYKWMPIVGSNGGVVVYDSGEDILSSSDDRQRFINASNSELGTPQVLSIAEDRDGAIWVGTSEGPVIFDCGSNVLTDECRGVRRIVTQDNIPALLLADQEIHAIAVDGANRKWFGTKTGIYVQSPNGEKQVSHFTKTNSPLFDNEITALSYDSSSGVMWIGTNKGIMSYNTGSTAGADRFRAVDVYAYPNPVPPSYRGTIAIKGLVEDAIVKITDINGQLITEIQALGGQATWDGKDARGRDISSGIYLVFASDDDSFDSPESYVTKIMVLR